MQVAAIILYDACVERRRSIDKCDLVENVLLVTSSKVHEITYRILAEGKILFINPQQVSGWIRCICYHLKWMAKI